MFFFRVCIAHDSPTMEQAGPVQAKRARAGCCRGTHTGNGPWDPWTLAGPLVGEGSGRHTDKLESESFLLCCPN